MYIGAVVLQVHVGLQRFAGHFTVVHTFGSWDPTNEKRE